MDKNAIKKYAVWARRELVSRVSQRALKYGISDKETGNPGDDSVGGHMLSSVEKQQRAALIGQIHEKGYEQVMEEAAYTWFNRFSALRFMEVNGYLPSRVRVFTDEQDAFRPQILTEAIHLELDGLDMEKVYAYKEANDDDELYKYLLITQCNALSRVLPGMFQRIADYTELLFPDNLLREGSTVQQMIELIPEDDWRDQVQIIGWLYQYYNSEKKDEVFAALKNNVKITRENIPAATQLFTPDWIVRYMVENSLGRLWVEGHPNDELKSNWKYYLEETEQEPEVQAQLDSIREGYKTLKPEDIRCIDPCSGSGHILSYMFDVLMQIYESYGVDIRTAAQSIVEHNIYGLDIDERAAQLAYFSVMMKACQYDRRFLRRNIQPHVYAIAESNHVENSAVDYFCNGDVKLKEAMGTIIRELHDAKEYGSILTITPQDWDALYERFEEIRSDSHISGDAALRELLPLVQTAEALAKKYDVVATNPPYMGASNMNSKLNEFIKENYADYKSDFFSAFVIHCSEITKSSGYCGFFTPYVWMFIQSYEKMRNYLYTQATIETLIQFEYSAFEEATVPVCTFAFQNRHVQKKGCYLRLVDFRGGMEVQRQKTLEAIGKHNCGYYYEQTTENFYKIPGSPVAYWVSRNVIAAFDNNLLSNYAISNGQNITGNNDKYLRLFWEVNYENINHDYWAKCARGGGFRKYYGNDDNVILWTKTAREHYHQDKIARIVPEPLRFKEGITWSYITSGTPSFRKLWPFELFEKAGTSVFINDTEYLNRLLGLLNSVVSKTLLGLINPTLNYQVRDIFSIPVSEKVLTSTSIPVIVENNVAITQVEWDSYETSWDFRRHPLVPSTYEKQEQLDSQFAQSRMEKFSRLSWHYENWQQECEARFQQLKANEEELNRIFIDIYGLQDELTPEVADKDITVHRIYDSREDVPESMRGSNYVRTKRDEIVSLISYAVGCMFGRYSLDEAGLIYAGGDWNEKYAGYTGKETDAGEHTAVDSRDRTSGKAGSRFYYYRGTDKAALDCFPVDYDNIIPICDDEYFDDDIVGLFVDFVRTVYGAETLEENLKFIAEALGGNGQPREVIRNYFLNDFYADHCKTYQKRPIYWQFDSGKKNGFKCLIYMHRYQQDTIARIRTDYVHEQQARYRTAITDLENRVANASTAERVKLSRQLKALNDQAAEIHSYEEKIHHLADQMISIDLDDGVKHNYAIFQDVLAKIR